MEKFFSPELSRVNIAEVSPSIESICELMAFLENKTLLDEIQKGNITIALIRPELETTTENLPLGADAELAEALKSHITDLELVAEFAIKFDQQAYEEFYGGAPQQTLLTLPPRRHPEYRNRWEEFGNVMTNGPTTALLLYSKDGEAVAKWRELLGDRHIQEEKGEPTLRGQFCKDEYSTIMHGSDSIQAVIRELDIIKQLLVRSRV